MNIQDIIDFKVIDPRITYVLCQGADRVFEYSFRSPIYPGPVSYTHLTLPTTSRV